MPTTYDPYSIGKYRPTLKSSQQFGMVAIEFDSFTQRIAQHKGTFGAAEIIREEMTAFGKDMLAPVFRAFSPFKGGSGYGENTLYTWAEDGKHLRDSLRTEYVSEQLVLRMRQHGAYTVEGNGAGPILPTHGKNLRIELPGGRVIYRRSVSAYPATGWAKDAWTYIVQRGYVRDVEERIALRILATLFPQMPASAMPARPVFREGDMGTLGGRPRMSSEQYRKSLSSRTRPRTPTRRTPYTGVRKPSYGLPPGAEDV